MYFKFQRKSDLLVVDDDFAHLRSIHKNGDLEFVLYYKVSPSEAIQNDAMTVNVTVFSRTIAKKPLFENTQTGRVDTKRFVNNILTQVPDAKSVAKQQEQFAVAIKNSDILAKVNNEVIGQLKAKVPAKDIVQMNRSKLKLVQAKTIKESAQSKPILTKSMHTSIVDTYSVFSGSIDDDPMKLMTDMVVRQGIDPSHVAGMTHRSVTSRDSLRGTLRPSRTQEHANSPSSRLLNVHLFPASAQRQQLTTNQAGDGEYVQVLTSEPVVDVEIPVRIIVPKHARFVDGSEQSHFFAKFDLVSGRSGGALDSVTRSLDVSKHVQLFSTPRKPPIVKASKSEPSSRATLEIKQVDPGATGVRVYRKIVQASSADIEDYTLFGTYDLKSTDQSLLIRVELPRYSPAIYRVVPVGAYGTIGFEYTNVVIRPKKFQHLKSIALVAQQVETGINIEARKIPSHVVAIEFKGRNLSTHETDYRNIGSTITFIDDSIRRADYASAVDTLVRPGNVYEYVARLIYDTGTSEQSGDAIIEFIQPAPGKVDTKISDVSVQRDDDINVTFSMSTTIIDTNIDIVRALLKRQDIYDAFQNDVIREREFLKSLIAHNVQRIDLTTGKRDDFGVITDETFSDRDLRKNQSILPLVGGHKYRYEIVALVRSPETMFDTLNKTKRDAVTKRTYTFSPAKFMHPITLSRGTLVSAQGLKTRYSKESMSHGVIGSIETVEVAFDADPARVVDATASRFDKYLNIVTWRVSGPIEHVDHFIVMKEVSGVRSIIGKAHSEFSYGNCQFIHQLSPRDEGALTYIVTPCFNDYAMGESAKTNIVLVDEFENDVARVARR